MFFNTKHFLLKFFLNPQFFGSTFLDRKFLAPKLLLKPKHFFDPKFVWTHTFLDPSFFKPKFFWTQPKLFFNINFFTKNYFLPKIANINFLDSKFCWIRILQIIFNGSKLHLRMEFDSGDGLTCILFYSILSYLISFYFILSEQEFDFVFTCHIRKTRPPCKKTPSTITLTQLLAEGMTLHI